MRIRELADRGRAEREQAKFDASIATFEEAQHIAESAGDFQSTIYLASEVSATLDRAGRFEERVELLRRIEKSLDGHQEDPEFVATVLVHVHANLAMTLLPLLRSTEAMVEAQKAVDVLDSTQDAASRGAACNALGWTLMALGRPAEAQAWLRRAHQESESLEPSDPRRFEAGCNLAQCLGELGNREAALELANGLVLELESRGTFPPFLGHKAYWLRGSLRFYDDWNSSEKDLRRSLEFLEASGVGPDQIVFQLTTLDLAHAIRNAGRPEESAALERRALAALRESHGSTNLVTIRAAVFLAGSLWDIADRNGKREGLEEARRLYEEAARTSQEIASPDAFTVFAPLGDLLLDRFDDLGAAESWLRAAVDTIESRASGTLAIDERSRADLFHQRRFHKRHDPYEGLIRCLVRKGKPSEALEVLEHSRARSLADLLERSRIDPIQEALQRAQETGDEHAARRLRALPGEVDEALASAAAARTGTDSAASRTKIRAAYEQIRRLRTERAELTRSVTTSGKPASIDEVRSLLGKDEALLAYFLGRSASFAFLAPPPGGTVLCFPLTDEDGRSLTLDAVAQASQDWIQSISRGAGDPSRGMPPSAARPPREPSSRTRGNRMFSSLVPPALWAELRKRTLVHLLPHGPLNWIPFEALRVGSQEGSGDPVYWIDVGPAIAYQESGSALVWAERRRKAQIAAPNAGPALLVADPAYGSAADSGSPQPSADGPVVVRVQRGGLAAQSGVRVGDVISSISGSRVASVSEVGDLLRASPGKASTDLVVKRSGAERSIRIGPGDPGMEIAPSLPPHLSEPIGRTRAQPLERLPGTAREAEAVRVAIEGQGAEIGRVARSVVLLRGEDATESLLTAWAPEAAVLHIAAHQIPDPAGCSDSARLALTTPLIPTAEDDGFLDLDDLLLHWRGRLERCELAVLSSCWSRTGRLEREEGFFGLPLGLRFAGCPSIVASLWPVDDEVTASLMTEFYKNLEKPGDAGRLRAFLDARRSVKREYPDPYYWAAFVWSGAPR